MNTTAPAPINETHIAFSMTHAAELCAFMGTDRDTLRTTRLNWRMDELGICREGRIIGGRFFILRTDKYADGTRVLEFANRADYDSYIEWCKKPTQEARAW